MEKRVTSNALEPQPRPAHLIALHRHFADLRDGTHGDQRTRQAKEQLFSHAVDLLDPVARLVLDEVDASLLLHSGTVRSTGLLRDADGGLRAHWTLSWSEQRTADLPPATLTAHYGPTFHHPHLRGATVGEWPLNVFDEADANAQLPVLRSITAADLHNLVYRRDYRLIPGIA